MNKIYKVIWSKTRNCYVAVSELAKNHGKDSVRSEKRSLVKGMSALALGIALSLGVTGNALADETVTGNLTVTGDIIKVGSNGTITVDANHNSLFGESNTLENRPRYTNFYDTLLGNTNRIFYGNYSTAIGNSNTINGYVNGNSGSPANYSTAIGSSNNVNGSNHTAIGSNNNIINNGSSSYYGISNSTAIGYSNDVYGAQNITIGSDNDIRGKYNANTSNNVAIGQNAHIIGDSNGSNIAIGSSAYITDYYLSNGNPQAATGFTEAADDYWYVHAPIRDSIAMGTSSYALSSKVTAVGNYTRVVGPNSSAFGYGAQIYGQGNNTAIGSYSLAGFPYAKKWDGDKGRYVRDSLYGADNTAVGSYSMAGSGYNNVAIGARSRAGYWSQVSYNERMAALQAAAMEQYGNYEGVMNEVQKRAVEIIDAQIKGNPPEGYDGWSEQDKESYRNWQVNQYLNFSASHVNMDDGYSPEDTGGSRIINDILFEQWLKMKNNNQIQSDDYSTAVGVEASAEGVGQTAIGGHAQALGWSSMAIGLGSKATGASSMAIGESSLAAGDQSIAIGLGNYDRTQTWGYHATAIGINAHADTSSAIAIGDGAKIDYDEAGADILQRRVAMNAIAVGQNARAAALDGTAVGRNTKAIMRNATAYGNNAHANAWNSIAIGNKAIAGLAENIYEEKVDDYGNVTGYEVHPTVKVTDDDGLEYVTKGAEYGDSAVAIGNRAKAIKEYTTAVGAGTNAEGWHAVAVGDSNQATGKFSTAIGAGWSENYTPGEENDDGSSSDQDSINTEKERIYTAMGANQAGGDYSTAVGYMNQTVGTQSTALGKDNAISGLSSLGVGAGNEVGKVEIDEKTGLLKKSESQTNTVSGYAVGSYNKITGTKDSNAGAFGAGNEVAGDNGYAVGNSNTISEDATGALAVGSGNTVKGEQSIAVGTGHTVTGKNSGAFGDPDIVEADGSYVFGNKSKIESTNAKGSFVVGNEAEAKVEKSVALGSDSVASRDTTVQGGYNVLTKETQYVDPDNEAPWKSTRGAVAVGDVDNGITRQITGVAAGREDTDAVNVAQLKLAVGGVAGANYELETSKTDNEVNKDSIVNTYHVELREEGGKEPVGKTLDIVDSDTKYTVQKGETTKQGDTTYNLVDSSGTTVGTFVNTHTTVKGDKYITVELTNEDKISETVSPEYTVSLNLEDIKKEVNTDTTYTADQSVKASENPGEGSTTFNIYKNGDKEDIAGSMTIQAGNNVTITEEKDGDKSIAVVNAQDTTYQFTTVDGEPDTNVVSTTTVMSSTDGKDYKPTGETFKDTDTKVTNVTVNAGKKDNTGNTPYTITLNDNGDNKEGASKLTATFNVQDTTYTANQSVEAGTGWKDGKGGSTTFTITDSSGNNLKPMTVKAGDNVKITKGANGEAVIQGNGLKNDENPVVYDEKTGEGSVTITDQAGNTTKITNIRSDGGEGVADSINYLGDRINKLDNKIDKVGAGAAALAGLHPLDFDPDEKWDFAASVGSYKSEQAVALGAFYRPNEDTMFSIGGTIGNGNNMVNVGVSWKFGQKNRISANRISSAKEIIELRKNQEDVHSFLADAVAGNQLDLSKIQLFPDVEENHWAYDYVATMAGNGVLEGYPDGYFKGNRNMTRYEMAAVLYRLMQNGARLSDRALTEFAPELDRIRVDTITKHKDGTPHIQRVRTIKERVDEKADPSSKKETKKKAKIKVAEKPVE